MKEKVEFDEQKAIELIKKFNLSENTLRVWKTRGAIPVKYLDEKYKPPTEATKAEKILEQRINDILKSGLLNLTVVTELAEIQSQKSHDVVRGLSSYSHEEIIRLKTQINMLKITIVKTFEKKSNNELKKLLNNPAFVLKSIMSHCTKLDYDRANRIKLNKIQPTDLDYFIIKDAFIKAGLQLLV